LTSLFVGNRLKFGKQGEKINIIRSFI